MKALKLTTLIGVLLLLLLPSFSIAQTRLNKIASDHFEIIFPETQKDSLSILQFSDLHFGNDWLKDLKVGKRVRMMVNDNQPDLIIVTGDLFTGEKDRRSYVFPFVANCLDALGLPWLYVFGNHDPEGNVGREPIRDLFDSTDWGVIGFHSGGTGSIKCDYQVDLKLNNAKHPVWEIYAFDSGSEPGNRSIKAGQVLWFQEKSKESQKAHQQVIPAISIFHIPLKQYEMLWNDSTLTKQGFFNEKVCFEEDDGQVYEAFLKQGNIKACICGHDHDNNYWGKYHGGILLVYGHVTGEACYHRHWPAGGKLIKLPVKGGELGIKDMVQIVD
jgi:3',5'-cyclic AMP phosphodiesterase CpdA